MGDAFCNDNLMYNVYEFLKILSHSKHSFTHSLSLSLFLSFSLSLSLSHAHTHTYTHQFTAVHSGGIVLTFIGTNLDVVQNPVLVVNDPQYLNVTNVSIKFNYYGYCDHLLMLFRVQVVQ